MSVEHKSVMLAEAIEGLNIKASGTYVDATYGRGGHSRAILEQLNKDAKLLVVDKDIDAINDALKLAKSDARVYVNKGPFKDLKKFCENHNVVGKVDGILFDLGVSSPQLDTAGRGFSFMRDGALDMRMDQSSGKSVAQWLVDADEAEIVDILKTYGQERFAKRIANAIVSIRETKPIKTTQQLVDIITAAMPIKDKHKHPATRTFQALRIYINNELEELKQVLEQTIEILAPHGRLVIISFHSLEDRIAKQFIVKQSKGEQLPHWLPIANAKAKNVNLKKISKLKPSAKEIATNVRSRSAIMRVAEKVAEVSYD